MQAIRQIYDDIQATIAVPLELQHRKTEVIFMVFDDEPVATSEGLGTQIAKLFSNIPPPATKNDELVIPEREHGIAVTFE